MAHTQVIRMFLQFRPWSTHTPTHTHVHTGTGSHSCTHTHTHTHTNTHNAVTHNHCRGSRCRERGRVRETHANKALSCSLEGTDLRSAEQDRSSLTKERENNGDEVATGRGVICTP